MVSPAAQLIFAYPFLFPFHHRLFLFKTIALDPGLALKLIHTEFQSVPAKIKTQITTIHCTIAREALFEHGCFLINRLSGGRFTIHFNFEGEPGFGEGPSQEFFSGMAKEFCKREIKMWRDDFRIESPIVIAPNGLFPAVTADTGLLEILGFLCAKAILMDKILAIPLSSTFFKLVKNETVSLVDVDFELAAALRCPEGLFGLPFLYPGTGIEMKRGGRKLIVNAENVAEYVRLVEDFTCGSYIMSKMAYFMKSFETNIQRETLSLLSSEEIVRLISGEDVEITIDDLKQYVKLEHGYGLHSREIEDFFAIVAEMSVEDKRLLWQFLTGCDRLPNGGLSALHPQLTIAKRIPENGSLPDECLPSVMTCTNYLKLPAYSRKEIMKQKILQAITECRDTFLLS
jgi:E3 ubiquitin-protein ligase TRIP12